MVRQGLAQEGHGQAADINNYYQTMVRSFCPVYFTNTRRRTRRRKRHQKLTTSGQSAADFQHIIHHHIKHADWSQQNSWCCVVRVQVRQAKFSSGRVWLGKVQPRKSMVQAVDINNCGTTVSDHCSKLLPRLFDQYTKKNQKKTEASDPINVQTKCSGFSAHQPSPRLPPSMAAIITEETSIYSSRE